jgi:hypothetical protein
MVVDERGVFKDDSFQAAVAALQDGNAAAATAQSGKGANKGDKKQPKQVMEVVLAGEKKHCGFLCCWYANAHSAACEACP